MDESELQDPLAPPAADARRYANYFQVSMNPFEVAMSFGEFYLEDEEPRVHTRIVTSPRFALAFFELLSQSIRNFETEHGPLVPEASGGTRPGRSGGGEQA